MTTGDNYNIACPWCGKVLHNAAIGHVVQQGMVSQWRAQCRECDLPIRFSARWELKITAEEITPRIDLDDWTEEQLRQAERLDAAKKTRDILDAAARRDATSTTRPSEYD